MTVPIGQSAFTIGEVSPSLFGRFDLARNHLGASTFRNGFVSYRGGFYSRAGTAFVGFSKQTGRAFPPRMITFQFNINQGLALEFGHLYMRVVINGAYVLESPFAITGISNSNPAVVSFAALSTGLSVIADNSTVTASYQRGDLITLAGGAPVTVAQMQVLTTALVSLAVGGVGAGYVIGERITLAGGLSTPAPVVTVTSIGVGGTITGIAISVGGSFTSNGTGNFTQASTSGVGAGATFIDGRFGPHDLRFSIPGGYTAIPANPVNQGTTTGTGAGAKYNVTWATPGALANADWVNLSGVSGMTQVNGQTYVIGGLTANTFELFDVYGAPIDSTAFSAWTAGGDASRVYTLVTPYAEQDLPWLKFTESADDMSICCVNQDTSIEYPPQDLVRLADDNWQLQTVVATTSVRPPATLSGAASSGGTVDYAYQVTAVDPTDGTESVASPTAPINNAVNIAATAGTITLTWQAVVGVSEFNVYKATPGDGVAPPAGSLFGFAGKAYGTQFLDSNIVADFSQVPPQHNDPFAQEQIIDVEPVNPGSGYSTATVTINSLTGSGAVVVPIIVGGAVVDYLVQDGGSNYLPTDTVTVSGNVGGSGAVANYTVSPTDGAILAVTVTNGGHNYSPGTTATAAGGDGSAILVPQIFGGVITSVLIQNAGETYTAGPITFTDAAGPTNATARLVLGPASGTFPGTVAYFQERRGYANTLNQTDTYFFSQPGAFKNFDRRIPTIGSDAIIGAPWSVQVNGIQFMIPMPGGLVVLTGLSAWQLTGTGGSSLNPQPLEPSTQQAQPQAYNGCSATIPPIKIDYDIIYVQAKGSIVRDLSYQFYTNIYTGTDLTLNSSQLFTGYTLKEWAWCEEPYKVLWAVRDDGILLSLTFLKPQEIAGWGRSDTNGLFVSVCAVTEPPVDALYVATQRFPGDKTAYMIERMNNRIWQQIEDCWCVDAGLTLPQPQPQATLSASSATGLGACAGVSNLSGGSNWSAGTFAVVVDAPMQPGSPGGPGAGATPVLTIVGGVITNIAFAPGGTGYLNPQLVFTDPANTGSGATATVALDNSATFSANAPVFALGNVGSVIRSGGGIATVTAFIDATHVTANILTPIARTIPNSGGRPLPQVAGNWTMTAPVTKITGLNHLIGATVTGLADGNVVPPTVVAADGTITLATPASSVTIGLGFTAQLQSLYLDHGEPTIQAGRKKVAAVNARIESSRGLQIGSNQPDGSTQSPAQTDVPWRNLTPVPDNGPNFPLAPYNALATPLRTGDIRCPVGGGYATPGQVCIQQQNPLPMQVLSIVNETMPGDDPQLKAPAKQSGGQK